MKNRYLDVGHKPDVESQSAKLALWDGALEWLAILERIASNLIIKQKELSQESGKSIRTIKHITQVFYFRNATAVFSSFTAEPETVSF